MRSAALISLLPFLATLATARPSPSSQSVDTSDRLRKSLSFGPTHSHASFEIVNELAEVGLLGEGEEVDPVKVAKGFLSKRVGEEGDSFYLRPDVSLPAQTHS
jgi:extracellular elastinolytic metalloproteinase